MIFICKNKDCKLFGQEQEFNKFSYKLVENKLQSTSICPKCKKIMTEVPNNIPLSEKNFEIGEYNGMTREGKQEMLKKRAHDHYEKKIKPYKDHMNDRLKKEITGKI